MTPDDYLKAAISNSKGLKSLLKLGLYVHQHYPGGVFKVFNPGANVFFLSVAKYQANNDIITKSQADKIRQMLTEPNKFTPFKQWVESYAPGFFTPQWLTAAGQILSANNANLKLHIDLWEPNGLPPVPADVPVTFDDLAEELGDNAAVPGVQEVVAVLNKISSLEKKIAFKNGIDKLNTPGLYPKIKVLTVKEPDAISIWADTKHFDPALDIANLTPVKVPEEERRPERKKNEDPELDDMGF